MAGRRYGSFRSGDIAESLGATLLKSIATVAEVPRPEDVGIDAVANLLRTADDGSLYAEDTFTVQFKSNSESIDLKPHEVDWFTALTVPHFIGRVNRSAVSLELYTTHMGRHAIRAGQPTRVRFQFQPDPRHSVCLESMGYAHFLEGETAFVWLGDPVVRIALPSITDRRATETSYSALKSFLWAERISMQFSHLGLATALQWKTDIGVVDVRQLGFFGSNPEEGLPELVAFAAPLMISLFAYGTALKDSSASESLLKSISAVADSLVQSGVGRGSDSLIGYWDRIYRSLVLRYARREIE